MSKTDAIKKELEAHSEVIGSLGESCGKQIEEAAAKIIGSIKGGGKVLLFGNGGSAADAQHIAAELVGRFKLEREAIPAIALTTNTSVLTAIGNDYGFQDVFSRQVEALATKGDIAIGISTSGNSPNVIKGLEAAKAKGAYTMALTKEGETEMSKVSDMLIGVPSDSTPRIQEAHILIGHIICMLVEEELAKGGASS